MVIATMRRPAVDIAYEPVATAAKRKWNEPLMLLVQLLCTAAQSS